MEKEIRTGQHIARYFNKELLPEQEQELKAWLAESSGHQQLLDQLNSPEWLSAELEKFEQYHESELYRRAIDMLQNKEAEIPVRSISFFRKWRWVAAAVLLFGVGVVMYHLNFQSKESLDNKDTVVAQQDIAAGTNRATLTINNNQRIDLASDKKGIRVGESVRYNDGERIAGAGQWLQLATPRGGQYEAVLPDGSKVWLNAASSIKFPSAFGDKERRVEVSGEVYFEIAKDASRPFKVNSRNQETEVLGTSFNVYVYPDESVHQTTLINGAVKISSGQRQVILKPGEAALLKENLSIIHPDTEQVVAWKNGLFNFDNSNLAQLMKQLERWYDIEVVYQNNIIPDLEFGGKMSRSTSLLSLLSGLKDAGVKFQLKDRILTVLH